MKKILFHAVVLSSALAVSLIAQDNSAQNDKPKHHHYKLIDVGTFGGPQSSVVDDGIPGTFVNNSGEFIGFADTPNSDPFQNFCFIDCFVDHAFRWQNGVMTDLGVLPNGWSSAAAAISPNGLVAGFAQTGELDPLIPGFPQLRAVLWRNGSITDLGTLPGGYESVANAVNSRGQIVGASVNGTPDPNTLASLTFNFLFGTTQLRAILWSDGVMQDLGTLGGDDALAALINERGQVMGWSYTSVTQPGGCFPLAIGSFIWEKEGGMRDLGGFGGTCTFAQDLNNRGQVVGFATPAGDGSSRAFIWENGSISDLGGSLGGSSTGAFVVNEAGQAAGFGYLAGDTYFHAALWDQTGRIADLGTLGDDPCSSAKAINARGQVVGDSISLSNCLTSEDASRAFLWEDGAIFDLNNLIPTGSPLYLIHPQNINDRGEIAGFGADASGNQHAFLLIPCDENHPAVQGCDYSMVDTTATPQVASPSAPHGLTTPHQVRPGFPQFNPTLHFGQHPGPWNRALRVHTLTPTLNTQSPASWQNRNARVHLLLTARPLIIYSTQVFYCEDIASKKTAS